MKLNFPIKGIHKGAAGSAQPEFTSPDMNNVRPFDALERKARGGQRPGLSKLYTQQITDRDAAVVAICSVTTVS